jgi:hypothetical protein
MALFRMPDTLARELILYYVSQGARGRAADDRLKAIVSSVCQLPVTSVLVYETERRRSRCARITLPSTYSAAFESIFPNAHRLKDPAPGLATFRLAGSNRSPHA